MLVDPIIPHIEFVLYTMAFRDIERASQGNSKIGAFILASCFIEYLAGFRYGKATNRADYKSFVKSYLPDYDPEKLYRDLRCKLVHNYSEGGSYAFTDANPELHGKLMNDDKIIINLENFIADIEKAMTCLFKEIETNSEVQSLAIKRFKDIGLIGVIRLTKKNDKG